MTDYISKITLPNGDNFLIKDQAARQDIQTLKDTVVGTTHYRGTANATQTSINGTDKNMKDGATSNGNIIMTDGTALTPQNGDIIIIGTSGTNAAAPKEYIFKLTDPTGPTGVWNEFGSTGSLKALAFKDNATASYTPQGTINALTFTGTAATISSTYKPVGTISTPSFTGTTATITVTSEPLQSAVTISTASSGSANYTPGGTISRPTFTGSSSTVRLTSGTGPGGETNYTPEGSNSAPTLSVSTRNEDVYVIKQTLDQVGQTVPAIGTSPSLSMTVNSENLTIGWDAGTLPICEQKSVANGIARATAEAPIFTGAGTYFSGTVTPNGSVSTPSFTGTGVRLVGELDGESTIESTGEYEPTGRISTPVFTGTTTTATAHYTPAGAITQPVFTGTRASITVS